MASTRAGPAAFGEADLSNCEREQIHLAASIQPHGALLVAREPDGVIVQASANAQSFLGLSEPPQGRELRSLGGTLWDRARSHLAGRLESIPVSIARAIGGPAGRLDALIHRAPGGGLVVELEHAGPSADISESVESVVGAALAAPSLQALCDESARIFKRVLGYDRVMIYRFDDEGHGEVFSETKKPDLEAFLGNRYPASDIPEIARRLYERNRVRLLADIHYAPVPLVPRLSPLTGEELDMSLCFLRSVSPIHVQYLTNMGVAATLVVSLMVGGRLWGLVSCHHYSPRTLPFQTRALCEVFAEIIATRIAALESFAQGQGELSVRRLEQRMIERVSAEGDWRGALFDGSRALLAPLGATGAALVFEGQILAAGETPDPGGVRAIARWLEGKPFFATASLGAEEPSFAALSGVASGLVATRVSGDPDEILLWFRKERIRTVTWGGNPFKPPSSSDDPRELSPRRSFAQWHQVVEGTSDPWTAGDLRAARMIGASVTDVVVQFRSVRVLIAQDHLRHVSRQVQSSGQHVVIADSEGRILQATGAFDALAGDAAREPKRLDDLPAYFVEAGEVAGQLSALRKRGRPWRGEAALAAESGAPRPLLIRADPVVSGPERVLGFVLLFTDLADQKRAEAARRRFQDEIPLRHRHAASPPDSGADREFQALMSSIVENAQLAALEITGGVELAQMPDMLESLRTSVSRAAEVLEQLSIGGRSARNERPERDIR